MDALFALLFSYGYLGFFVAAFIAGSVFPFSSEAIMVALIAAGLDPVQLVIYGTVGNTLGSMFNYSVGRMGKPEWISKYLHVKEEKLKKTEKFLAGHGAWMGVLTFLPILGSAISVALGLMRANVVITTMSVAIGKFVRYVVLMIGTTALVGCTASPRHESKDVITVSIEPLRYFTEGVAGDKFEVRTILPDGASPETYEPTATQMMALSESRLYIKAGRLGFETSWTERFQNAAPHMTVADASQGIEDRNDPHTWTSPGNARIILHNITKALIGIDAEDSLYFIHRSDSICSRISQLSNRIAAATEKAANRAFVIYHPTLTYFARDYGLQQIAVEEEGKEPSASRMKDIIEQAGRSNARVILLQKEFTRHNVAPLAETLNARIREINPLAYDWEKEMWNITQAICNQ